MINVYQSLGRRLGSSKKRKMSLVEHYMNFDDKGMWIHSSSNSSNGGGKNDLNRGFAELKRGIGNILYSEMQYEMALNVYTEAIELYADPTSYIARSSCNMMLHKYKEALEDAKQSVELDPKNVEGYLQIARCALALGDCPVAHQALNTIKEIGSSSIEAKLEASKISTIYSLQEESDKAYAKGEYGKVVKFADRILVRLPSRNVKLRRAECLALLGQYEQANDVASSILILDKENGDALYVLSICHFYQGHVDVAIKRLQRLFELKNESEKAKTFYDKVNSLKKKREEAKKASDSGQLKESHALYSDALRIDPQNTVINSQLYYSRALVCYKMGNLKEAVEDCSSALKLNKRDILSLLLRGKTFMSMREYKLAAEDFESACKMKDDWESRRLLQQAKSLLSNEGSADHYTTLGVDRAASTAEIKRAYWKKALLHHPDKHTKATADEKKQQEKMFKEIAQAYEVLSDPNKRFLYDKGYNFK